MNIGEVKRVKHESSCSARALVNGWCNRKDGGGKPTPSISTVGRHEALTTVMVKQVVSDTVTVDTVLSCGGDGHCGWSGRWDLSVRFQHRDGCRWNWPDSDEVELPAYAC